MILREYYNQCSIPVKEVNIPVWLEKKRKIIPSLKNWHLDDEFPFAGIFLVLTPKEAEKAKLPEAFIIIDKNMPKCDKLGVFFHEWGHYVCFIANCKCDRQSEDSNVLGETHADQFALSKALEYKEKRAIQYRMVAMLDQLVFLADPIYSEAAGLTVRSDIYKKCEKFLDLPKNAFRRGCKAWAESQRTDILCRKTA